MQRITIGRYRYPDDMVVPAGTAITDEYAGWIEGVRDDDTTWIMWLDANANPCVFWGTRDEDGAVSGEPVFLGATPRLVG